MSSGVKTAGVTAFLERLWKILISLKFAVIVIVGMAIALAIATILESKYDTRTAQYVVYQSIWFYILLSLFGLLILAVAISRIPWKKKHIPFLMAHAGILMILVGSAITALNGIDGNLRITEGEVNSSVELDSQVLVFKRGDAVESMEFPWMPEFKAKSFAGQAFPKYGVEVSKFIADAEMKLDFRPVAMPSPSLADAAATAKGSAAHPGTRTADDAAATAKKAGTASASPTPAAVKAAPAVQIKIVGAPVGGAPEIWLWSGDPGWSSQKLGPARFLVRREDQADLSPPSEGPEARMDFVATKNGELRFEAVSPRGEKRSGKISLPINKNGVFVSEEPTIVDPGWRMPIKIIVRKFIPHAANHVEYVTTKNKQQGGPVPALQIHLIGEGDQPQARMWLGLGDRADLITSKGEEVSVGYFPKRLVLPFALRLHRFEMKHNPGTMDPSAYSSHVQVVDQLKGDGANLDALPAKEISMNEPLKHGGYTFYQASFIPDFPRAVTTVLSVNYDPGRALKYSGSLLLVLGSIFLYLMKLAQSRRKPQPSSTGAKA